MFTSPICAAKPAGWSLKRKPEPRAPNHASVNQSKRSRRCAALLTLALARSRWGASALLRRKGQAVCSCLMSCAAIRYIVSALWPKKRLTPSLVKYLTITTVRIRQMIAVILSPAVTFPPGMRPTSDSKLSGTVANSSQIL